MLLVIRTTLLPQVWLFVFSFPVILACSFGFHVPVRSAHSSDVWCLKSLVRVPLAFTYRYVWNFDICFELYLVRVLGLPRTDTFGLLMLASHHTRSIGLTAWSVGHLVTALLCIRPISFCLGS